jgi:putative FmdB family regulatory protein
VPFYDYICNNCGHQVEVMHSVEGLGPAECPNCHGPMRKSISAPAVHFKGSGWARKEPSGKSGRAGAKESREQKAGSSDSPAPVSSGSSAESSSTGDSSQSSSSSASASGGSASKDPD